MPTNVIMPALELAQETGKVIHWLRSPGDRVTVGEPLVEIETDKVTTEIEAPASGVLGDVTARAGDVIPVGQTIARIFAADEARSVGATPVVAPAPTSTGRVEKADVLAYVESRTASFVGGGTVARLVAASPKARRLAMERALDLGALSGSGPDGAILAADVVDVVATTDLTAPGIPEVPGGLRPEAPAAPMAQAPPVGTVWRIMAERMTASWTTAPHFYLVRDVNVSRLVVWRERAAKQSGARLTYTDLLVKLVAATLSQHPAANASWRDGGIVRNAVVNIGLAVAIDDGLVVPVVHRADTLTLAEISTRREDMVARAQAGKLRPADIQGAGFTISNLGMYGVDAFNAIVNPPQAAILAVGRIADRVIAVGGQPAVRPTMVLTLSCDHRAIDGARAAQFLGALADLIEEPLALLV